MTLKQLLPFAFILIFISCKNQNKEANSVEGSQKTTTNTTSNDSLQTNILQTDSTKTVSSADLAGDRKLLANFYLKNDKKPQFFFINNTKDTTIICAEKTKITIRANSFVTSNSKNAVTGKIKISVKEYYSISDILLGRLSTTSNGKLLETGGMLDVNVFSENQKCDLKSGKAIEIAFPRKNEKEGMQLFSGNWKDDKIYWNLKKDAIDLNKAFTNVDEKPVYLDGGYEKMTKFISNNFIRSEDETNEKNYGRIYASFVIDKSGDVTDVWVTKGINKESDAEAIRVIKKLGKFSPGKINGIPVNVTYSLPITISDAEGQYKSQSGSTTYSTRKPKYYAPVIKTEDNIKADEIGYYAFSSTSLGYINCDRFLDYPESLLTDFAVNANETKNISMSIVFHRFKSILPGNLTTQKVIFSNALKKEKATIIAIKFYDNQAFLAVKETTISQKPERDLVFTPVSPETLLTEIKKLNRFN
ncbi:MAG: hypothetical protein EOO44_10050 [Flavobacterium sp.]|nr:MAG: hypothetical protein EOO44_10050 [Flavobacterium sp.]